MSFIVHRGVALGFVLAAITSQTNAAAEERLDRATILRVAIANHPAVAASDQNARAARLSASASGKLPPPEVMVQVWQVPIERPYAISDAGMVMVGVEQTFPAPGSRAARENAGTEMASAERAMVDERMRTVRRDVDHAFADYVEATARHHVHLEHRALAQRAMDVARARLAGGAALTDVTQADVELARVEADVIGDRSKMLGARARLNALLRRDPEASLGTPSANEPETATWNIRESLAKALETRPEVRAADAQKRGRSEEAHAARNEANLPAFSVAALYFAPVGPMPVHGYGANATMTLPWVWGEAAARRDAASAHALGAERQVEAAKVSVASEVARADAEVNAAALRLQALRDRALPAAKKSFEIARAGYEASRADILTLLSAQRAVVDVETEIVAARATLDHALAELDAAVGQEVPRRPLGPLSASAFGEGGSDVH